MLIYERFFLVLVLVPVAEAVVVRALRLVFVFCGDKGSGEGDPRDDVVDSLEDLRTAFSSGTRPCFWVFGVLVFRWVRRAGVVGGRGATSSSSSPSGSP